MQSKRRRISMADLSAEPRPEERSARRRVSKDAPVSAFARGAWGGLLLSGLGVVALAFAPSLVFAAPQSPLESPSADLGGEVRILARFSSEITRGPSGSVSSPLVAEDQGGGSRYPSQQESSAACDNSLRDPPPIGRSEERPSVGRPMPAPAREGGCANAIGSM